MQLPTHTILKCPKLTQSTVQEGHLIVTEQESAYTTVYTVALTFGIPKTNLFYFELILPI